MPTVSAKIGPLLTGLKDLAPPQLPSLKLLSKRARLTEEDRIPPLLPRLVIPSRDTTKDMVAHNRYFAQGQFLSRQENWAELGRLIRTFDEQRLQTPGGTPISQVLAAGARADAMQAAVEAVLHQDEATAHHTMDMLTDVFDEHCADHGVAYVVAVAHIELGYAWSRGYPAASLPTLNKGASHAHYRAAAKILDRFDAFELDAPTLAVARCAMLAGEARPDLRVADDFEDLIDLDPKAACHMRAMGEALLPRNYGSYRRLETEARRTAERTRDHWGAAGYTWTYLDALTLDSGAFALLDAEFFVAGMHDILERCPGQHSANLLAAFTGQTHVGTDTPADAPEARIAGCFDWIVSDHLREIHPILWMPTPGKGEPHTPQPANRDAQKTGRVRALSTLAEHFSSDIRAGNRVIFDETGISLVASH